MSSENKNSSMPLVAHFKDKFLPASETFIYELVGGLKHYRSIVIDRHRRQNRDLFPFEEHFSPAESIGPLYATFERLALRSLGRSPYLERVLRREGVSIIHAHFGQLGALIAPVAALMHLPLVVSFHGNDISTFVGDPAWKSRFSNMWHLADTVLAISPHMAQQLETAGCPKKKLSILPVPVDTEHFRNVQRPVPEPGRPIRLLTVGRLVKKKGIDVLLQSISHMPAGQNVELVIAGDGPEKDNLERLARRLGITQRTSFVGWLNHDAVVTAMNQAHLFVLPSRTDPETGETEGTPTVLLEAQATGLPVLSTYHAGIPDIVHEGETGWLVPESDPQALANQLQRILGLTSEWSRISRNARDTVEQIHSQRKVVQQLEQIYDDCLART